MITIKVNKFNEIPRGFTGIAECENGTKIWFVNGKRHRLNGPAIEHSDGSKTWCINGELLGINDEGFWELWDLLTPEQKQDPILLSYLPTL